MYLKLENIAYSYNISYQCTYYVSFAFIFLTLCQAFIDMLLLCWLEDMHVWCQDLVSQALGVCQQKLLLK